MLAGRPRLTVDDLHTSTGIDGRDSLHGGRHEGGGMLCSQMGRLRPEMYAKRLLPIVTAKRCILCPEKEGGVFLKYF